MEWDLTAAERARETSGRPIHAGDFRELDLPEHGYDLIVMHHVFEHLDEPHAVLDRISNLLRPTGRAILVLPNPESLGARLFGRFWFAWEAPRHLVLPTTTALAHVARRQGFTPRIRTAPRAAIRNSAKSRAYAQGRDSHPVSIGVPDVLLGVAELGLVALGFDVGEETVAVLERASRQGPRAG